MVALLKAWYNSGVNREEMMSSTLIGPELEKNDNEMEEQKFDNIEEDQASVILKKKNNEKDYA